MNDTRLPAPPYGVPKGGTGRQVFISLGSNLGDRLQYIQRAVETIKKIASTKIRAVSSVYETEPVGKKNQPEFLNAAAELDTTVEARQLFRTLKGIEQSLGRTRAERWGPREIDLDLLYYDAEILADAELTVPHPEIHKRRFVLVPLAEIAGEFTDPAANKSITQILDRCTDTSIVKKTSFTIKM